VTAAANSEQVNLEEIYHALDVFLEPDQVTELRALHVEQRYGRAQTIAGYFDHERIGLMSKDAVKLTPSARGVYFVMNPLLPEVLARCCNRTAIAGEDVLAHDNDVLRRRWVMIDVDPVRRPHISATDAEKEKALEVVQAVRRDLDERGWPTPIEADSGNGYHLFYRVELPADDDGVVKRILQVLAKLHNTPAATIDCSVHNASRIAKLPGTLARKGDNVPMRPHRLGRLLNIPAELAPVPGALLHNLADQWAEPTKRPPTTKGSNNSTYNHRLLVEKWLQGRGVAFRVKRQPDDKGRSVYLLEQCPFDPSHAGKDSCVMQAPDGQMSAHCFHNSCLGRGWTQFKEKIGKPSADDFDPPLTKRTSSKSTPEHTPAPGPALTADGPDGGDLQSRQAYDVIAEHFRHVYEPVFRKGTTIYSARMQREVKQTEATSAPSKLLADMLLQVGDVPLNRKEQPDWNRVPQFFRTWAVVAWRDLLDSLPEEEDASEIANSAAVDFGGHVAAALYAIVNFGYKHERNEQTQVERRSLIDWCVLWAKDGDWARVRSYTLWTCRERLMVKIALRVDLFRQVGHKELGGLDQRRFSQLCEQYQVGRSGRAGGQRVVELDPLFLHGRMGLPYQDLGEANDRDTGRFDGQTASCAPTCEQASTRQQEGQTDAR
jgi:hypothetical protein